MTISQPLTLQPENRSNWANLSVSREDSRLEEFPLLNYDFGEDEDDPQFHSFREMCAVRVLRPIIKSRENLV